MSDHDPKSYEAAQGKIKTLYAALTSGNEENRQLQAKVEQLENAIQMQQNDLIDKLNSIISKEYDSRVEQVQKLQAKVEELEAKNNGLIGKSAVMQNKVEELEAEHQKDHDEIIDLGLQYGDRIEDLQAEVEKLEAALALLDKNTFQHAKPYMVCVPTKVWRKVFPALKEDE
jgi:chromosome segregation ATPase